MRRMRDVPVSSVMAIMMRLGGRAGEEEGRTGDERGRREPNEKAESGATITQRHERALFNFAQRQRPDRHSCGTHTVVNDMSARLRGG
jgi:hypothetical protein